MGNTQKTNADNQVTKRPGEILMAIGLGLAGFAFIIIVIALAGGGGLTAYTVGALILGLVLAVIGFAQRLLAAVERR